MNKAAKIWYPGITGTSFMTMFSYVVSVLERENFSEPEHLGTMLNRLLPCISKKVCKAAGWNLHYLIGLLFAAAYVKLWESERIKPSFNSGFSLGAGSGIFAVIIWKITFKAHPAPPWINYKKYYVQLVAAHVVFALFATLTYKMMRSDSEDEKRLGRRIYPRKLSNVVM